MSFTKDDVESVVTSALQAYTRVDTQNLEQRMTLLENRLVNHMEWEERNGDALKEALGNQQRLIEKIFNKIDANFAHTDTCRVGLEAKIKEDYVSKQDLELILEKRNRYNVEQHDKADKALTECANGLRDQIRSNERKISNYSLVATTVISVVMLTPKIIEWLGIAGVTK